MNGRPRTLAQGWTRPDADLTSGPRGKRARLPTLRGFPRHPEDTDRNLLVAAPGSSGEDPRSVEAPLPPGPCALQPGTRQPRRAAPARHASPRWLPAGVCAGGRRGPASPSGCRRSGRTGKTKAHGPCCSSGQRCRRQRFCFLQRATGYLRGGKQNEIRFVLESPPPTGDDLSSAGSNVRSRGASGHPGWEDRGIPVPQPLGGSGSGGRFAITNTVVSSDFSESQPAVFLFVGRTTCLERTPSPFFPPDWVAGWATWWQSWLTFTGASKRLDAEGHPRDRSPLWTALKGRVSSDLSGFQINYFRMAARW